MNPTLTPVLPDHYGVATMMARTQISLPPEIHRRAKQRADELGVSFAEYVRGVLARDLGAAERRADVAALFALGDSGRPDVSTTKDARVAEAIATRRGPGRR